ncbi:hypothetical protein TREPR_1167 [Treponema primitia ZAS-2]|uniref:Uncharacterized protein n=2 Tax=Treponema primitia TaxID=88058 RepID=F5YGW1_TREPZ|nr:hypothetical protein TREPR_1167 [Treponema primitia ZAS-2]
MLTILASPVLRGPALRCIATIFTKFFFLQYRAALSPGLIPVTSVDHPLDAKVPFIPRWVDIYLDFVAFWIRILGFLLKHYRRRALGPVKDFLNSMTRLYYFAAEVYSKNMSTTHRPRYIARPRFFLIHLTDPHLMCIPSLHVMVMILSYTRFRQILRSFGDEEALKEQIGEVNARAALITEAILFVKQHSVNCVAAAMYAMSRFDSWRGVPRYPESNTSKEQHTPAACGGVVDSLLFPPEEAEVFVAGLFRDTLPPADAALIREHILALYRRFMAEGEGGGAWEEPLLGFLRGA